MDVTAAGIAVAVGGDYGYYEGNKTLSQQCAGIRSLECLLLSMDSVVRGKWNEFLLSLLDATEDVKLKVFPLWVRGAIPCLPRPFICV